jgi:hypothetical protein
MAVLSWLIHGCRPVALERLASLVAWFDATYYDGPQSFHGMSQFSFEYVNWSIAQVNYHAFAPAVLTDEPDLTHSA